jgi:1-deoxy-D-xylulose-5-phosphate synthase
VGAQGGVDRAGLVGEDGPTHHGVFDIAYLRHIPNMVVMAPKDENELQHMIKTAVEHPGPTAVRYPRGIGCGVPMDQELKSLPIGKAQLIKDGNEAVIIAIGNMVCPSIEAAKKLAEEGIAVAVVNARFVKPLDTEMIIAFAKKTGRLITVEEHVLQGGFGSAVLECLDTNGVSGIKTHRIGLPDSYIEHGAQTVLRQKYGLDAEGIYASVKEFIERSRLKSVATIAQLRTRDA